MGENSKHTFLKKTSATKNENWTDAEYEELDELEKRNTNNITFEESTRTNLSNRSNNLTQNEAFNTAPG